MSTQYEYVQSPARAAEVCALLRGARNVAVDTETTGLDPHKDRVILLSLSTKQNGTFVINTKDLRCLEVFKPLFEDEGVIKTLHNASFDYQMIKGSGGGDLENVICTMLGERTLTAGLQFDGYGLADITKKYLGKERDKTIRESFIGHSGDFTKEQLYYTAEDTADLLAIAQIMQEKAIEADVLKIWRMESQAVQAFADIEFYGQRIDPDRWSTVMNDNLAAAQKAKAELDIFFSSVCDRDLFGELSMNYDSTPMVLAKLREMGVEVDGQLIQNTDKKTQKKIKDHPVIKALTKYRTAMKGYSGFGEQYLKAIHPVTGRVHFRFNQYGTETGRPACRGGLNCLNIPRETRYRECFMSEEGRLISTVDYSGAELRIMADLSGDPLMVEGFNSGVDFHCFVAALLFNKEKVEKKDPLRTPTKTLNFGLAYGMGPGSLFDQLNANNYKISLDECRQLFDKYMNTFKTTINWLRTQQRTASREFVMTNINGRKRHWFKPDPEKIKTQIEEELRKKHRKVEDISEIYTEMQINAMVKDKRRAQLAAIEREGANFQIQSVNADMTKTAMARCRKEFKKRGWDARCYNSVYDEIVFDFHQSYAEEAHELQKKIMLDSANEMLKQVPMDVEGHLTKVWQK